MPNTLEALEKTFRVHFLDVGYADSIFIEFPNGQTMLVDAAKKDEGIHIVKYLRRHHVKKIDVALITHPHDNHFGGFEEVHKAFSISRVYINGDDRAEEGYDELLAQWERDEVPILRLQQGDSLDVGKPGCSIEILHPRDLLGGVNESAIVTWLNCGQMTILLTGDIGIDQQNELIEQLPDIASASVVQIPHHGGPISERFAEFIKGTIQIISTGPNRWDNPQQSDLDKLKGDVFNTSTGPFVVESIGQVISISH